MVIGLKIDYSGKGISSVKDLEINLLVKELNLSNNPLSSIDELPKLPNLETLIINDCNISELSGLDRFPKLDSLKASNNKIRIFPDIKHIQGISDLFLPGNLITKLPYIGEMHNLLMLYLSDNLIMDVEDFGYLPRLWFFVASNNPLNIDFLRKFYKGTSNGNLPNVQLLDISNTTIDWSTKEAYELIKKIKGQQTSVIECPSSMYIVDNDEYKVIRKVGEGGTFYIFLIEKQRLDPIDRETYLKMRGIAPDMTLERFKKESKAILADMVKKDEEIINQYKGGGLPPVPKTIIKFPAMLNALSELERNPEKVLHSAYPTGEFYVIRVPKRIDKERKRHDISGYRMLKDIGSENLSKKSVLTSIVLEGIKGIPRTYQEPQLIISLSYELKESNREFICLREQYIEGVPLDLFLKKNSIEGEGNLKLILDYIIKHLNILGDIHERGVVHNDISPNNIIVDTRGDVYLIDYGISSFTSKVYYGKESLPHNFEWIGKKGYASRRYSSPELLRGDDVLTPSSDLWSLGIILYGFIKGKHPLSDNHDDVCDLVSKREVFEEAKRRIDFNGVPAPLINIINKCMNYDSSERYQFAAEMKKDIENAVANL